ncbi:MULTISPECIES: HNH endonuclease signature motif containing protein [Aminobacterium]|jgi:hypothetical protein|uniref:HNH endonuclease signature motif containing protein n=1 Tax=Aminobacterium TaxID=81466 RepID=UPI00257F95AE|nr:HNH endonuclease signature motif containing protein [Aminobacterium sp. UBA4987]
MKLDISFPELDTIRKKIGAPLINWNPEPSINLPEAIFEISFENNENGDLILKKLFENPRKMASINGNLALIYIPEVRKEYIESRKFHFMECSHIQKMRDQGRYEQYIATNRLTGEFKMAIISSEQRYEEVIPLRVCRCCLQSFNYRGYKYAAKEQRDYIYDTFNIQDFLKETSSYFSALPKRRDFNMQMNTYPTNWKDISYVYRDSVRWKCEKCGVSLLQHHELLEVHHLDRVKNNCNVENLEALCKICHSDIHRNKIVTKEEKELIKHLRTTIA